jgi:hypothetical protein
MTTTTTEPTCWDALVSPELRTEIADLTHEFERAAEELRPLAIRAYRALQAVDAEENRAADDVHRLVDAVGEGAMVDRTIPLDDAIFEVVRAFSGSWRLHDVIWRLVCDLDTARGESADRDPEWLAGETAAAPQDVTE